METKFGNVRINKYGYYQITCGNNHNKLLHRLVWEDWYGKPIPEGYDIHHINGDKLDNRIQNLQCVEHRLHMRFHSKGEKNPFYGKKHTEKTKRKISEANKGRKLSEEHRRKISENHADFSGEKHPMYGKHHTEEARKKISEALNTTGYYRVIKTKNKRLKQGFYWQYVYPIEGKKRKAISSVDIDKLKEKVVAIGLPWYKLGDDNI